MVINRIPRSVDHAITPQRDGQDGAGRLAPSRCLSKPSKACLGGAFPRTQAASTLQGQMAPDVHLLAKEFSTQQGSVSVTKYDRGTGQCLTRESTL
jgi:hypothetical protein